MPMLINQRPRSDIKLRLLQNSVPQTPQRGIRIGNKPSANLDPDLPISRLKGSRRYRIIQHSRK